MDLFDAIKGRRSVRIFQPKELSEEDLTNIFEAARWAPSAGNIQPWILIAVKSCEKKIKLAKAALGQDFIAEAPIVIVTCVDLHQAHSTYGERGEALYCLQDSAAAIQNMLLASFALGLGGCWVGAFQEETVSKILGLTQRYKPVALIPIGYPAEKPTIRKKTLKEIIRLEKL